MNTPAPALALALILLLPLTACTSPPGPTPSAPAATAAATAAEVPAPASSPLPTTTKPAAALSVPKRGTRPATEGGSAVAFEVELQRQGCFGRCPSYRVRVTDDGRVQFVGERYVSATGVHEGQAAPAAVAALRVALQHEPFAALDGDYTPSDKRCGQAATDMASVRIMIRDGTARREIRHYLGCSQAPASLRALAAAIDEASGSSRWIDAPTE